VLARIVADRALDAEARRLGLSVGDARVAEAVRATPAFQGLNGEFDRQTYREALRRNGLNEEAFETSLREDSTRTILQAAVLGGMPKPQTYGDFLAAFSNERRSATWAAIGPEAVAVLPERPKRSCARIMMRIPNASRRPRSGRSPMPGSPPT
jgi:peptidyl-prolyl cis-trans isomerase D